MVSRIKEYKQQNGHEILKVFTSPTEFFYVDASLRDLIRSKSWSICEDRVSGGLARLAACQVNDFKPELLVSHVNGVGIDNVQDNLRFVSHAQFVHNVRSKGYFRSRDGSFYAKVIIQGSKIFSDKCATEFEAVQEACELHKKYCFRFSAHAPLGEDEYFLVCNPICFRYNNMSAYSKEGYLGYDYFFLLDRRNDRDILDLERRGVISGDEAINRHVMRYAADNAWYYYRYGLDYYFRHYNIPVPEFGINAEGYMTDKVTGRRLCPYEK